MTTHKKTEKIIGYYMNKLFAAEYECEQFQYQMQINKFNDFRNNPNVNTTTAEVNHEYNNIKAFI